MRRPRAWGDGVAKPDSKQATETLHEIESVFDRMAQWATANPITVLVVIGTLLGGAAAVGGYRAWQASQEAEASADIAEIQSEFRAAMGAPRGSLEIPEPANAEAAVATRTEFAARFREAADRRSGTAASVSAWLEAGRLSEALGDEAAATEARRAAIEEAPSGSALRALAHTQLAGSLERAGDPAAAAAEYLAAGQISDFPARALALGNAARCFADAGETARAIETFEQLGDEEAAKIPPHITARLAELRAAAGGPES
jgi:tetratricopeptide (TPR) repeat protein